MVSPRVRTTRKITRPVPAPKPEPKPEPKPAAAEPVAQPAPAKPDMALAWQLFGEVAVAFCRLRDAKERFLNHPALAPIMTDDRGVTRLASDIDCLSADDFLEDVYRRLEDASRGHF